MMHEKFDLIVIGGGPAGYMAAMVAGHWQKKVLIVEASPELGGAGIRTGTVPSKTLRETALALSGLRTRKLHGVDLSLRREATIQDFMRHEQFVIDSESSRISETLQNLNVKIVHGWGSFIDSHTIRVKSTDSAEESFYSGKRIVVATGSCPMRPETFEFADPRIHDSDEILKLDKIPKKLVIIGAGVIGSEYASTFATLGSEVHLIDGRQTLLPFLDAEISSTLLRCMQENGVNFIWQRKVTKCIASNAGIRIILDDNSEILADGVLVAAGRKGNVDCLNLEAAGVAVGERGAILVNGRFETNVANIIAIGDVIGSPALASTGSEQARVAISLAYDIPFKTEIASILPMGVYTIPEVGCVGDSEEQLRKKDIDYVVGRAYFRNSARGKIIGDEQGVLKLLFNRTDKKLLGVHIIGESATELVHVGVVAMLAGGGIDLINATCFNYPSLTELYRYATSDALLALSK